MLECNNSVLQALYWIHFSILSSLLSLPLSWPMQCGHNKMIKCNGELRECFTLNELFANKRYQNCIKNNKLRFIRRINHYFIATIRSLSICSGAPVSSQKLCGICRGYIYREKWAQIPKSPNYMLTTYAFRVHIERQGKSTLLGTKRWWERVRPKLSDRAKNDVWNCGVKRYGVWYVCNFGI